MPVPSDPPKGAAGESVDELRTRLAEAEETLRAIRSGEVDALVVSTSEGDRVFTLRGADEPYRIMLEQMSEGAASLSGDRVLLYANRRLAELLAVSISTLVGTPIERFVAAEDRALLAELFASREGDVRGSGEFTFLTGDDRQIRAHVSVTQLPETTGPSWSMVATDVTERVRVEEELERRVAARTADLERVNKELETFAYSVSHDLRAPLRAVDGFSKALLDDYWEELGDEGRHYLERLRAGAVRMGNLIDEILQLSRLSRHPFARAPVDMSALASDVIAELNTAEPDRRVQVEIQDGLLAEADPGLAQTVLHNLLDNAYKFTAKTTHPWIRFGAAEQDGVPVYFVADNGAGFDIAHADRLFRPFHRLHRESEFPGDGIGLATVARAVHRHDGVIWAQGAVNEGATFHFSLTPGAHPPPSAATGEDVFPILQPSADD
ncbi:MAG: sensor histidine kinase [Solirubrobacteraceae bacterium]